MSESELHALSPILTRPTITEPNKTRRHLLKQLPFHSDIMKSSPKTNDKPTQAATKTNGLTTNPTNRPQNPTDQPQNPTNRPQNPTDQPQNSTNRPQNLTKLYSQPKLTNHLIPIQTTTTRHHPILLTSQKLLMTPPKMT
eukprot:TCONS_00056704-protein